MADGDSHWVGWHRMYEADGSALQQRLAIVQRHLRAALDARPAGESTRILSLCAGQGRDVIEVLRGHPARERVRARLVELDSQLAADCRAAAAHDPTCAANIEVVEGDASVSDCAAGAVPADVVVACGIFGNISADDIRNFAKLLPMLCAPNATVIWTRHRRPPDLTPQVRAWFVDAGFEEVAFESPDERGVVGVGVHRLVTAPRRFESGVRLFTFVGDGGVF